MAVEPEVPEVPEMGEPGVAVAAVAADIRVAEPAPEPGAESVAVGTPEELPEQEQVEPGAEPVEVEVPRQAVAVAPCREDRPPAAVAVEVGRAALVVGTAG